MNRISLNGSSFVAAQCGYHSDSDWDACVEAVNDYYRPLETFAARFENMLFDVSALGFDALDIWTAGQLNWRWATQEHITMARALLESHAITVTSLGNDFGETRAEFVAACKLAAGVNTKLLSGACPMLRSERAFVIEMLEQYDLYLGLENHPEKSSQAMLDQIGDGAAGRIGTTVDTGWYATQAGDVVRVIEQLGNHIIHVHLKDVLGGGESDRNVGYGRGIVPLEACVRALKRIGYRGDYSVEIHSLDHDPKDELAEGLRLVRGWLE
jgi:sugar phosphate isomerase/epimerase